MAAIEAHGIGKRYGSFVALEDFTIAVQAGEIVGVLGPNGAGKTTAIRVLTTILAPSHGSFAVAGVPHSRPAEVRQRIGVLPESAGYPERQTGEQYLRYHARLYGHSRGSARAVARALLEEVGLSDRSQSLIASYSRGMRQRLGIARALVNQPETWCSSTSRPSGSIRRGSGRSSGTSAGSRASAGRPSCSAPTSSPRWRRTVRAC